MTERTGGETVEIGVIGLGVAARAMVPVLSRHGGFVLAATAPKSPRYWTGASR